MPSSAPPNTHAHTMRLVVVGLKRSTSCGHYSGGHSLAVQWRVALGGKGRQGSSCSTSHESLSLAYARRSSNSARNSVSVLTFARLDGSFGFGRRPHSEKQVTEFVFADYTPQLPECKKRDEN